MPQTLTIIFRGLLVFRQRPGSYFEVGMLRPLHAHDPVHVQRILVYKNGVLDGVSLLDSLHPEHRRLRLVVSNPTSSTVTRDQQGAMFDRMSHTYEKDYRFLLDIEEPTAHGPLSGKIDTSLLSRVIRISNGTFYTRLKSASLNRNQGAGSPTPFGHIAAAMACDIELTGSDATLVADSLPTTQVYNFPVDPTGRTLYEISNSPADTWEPTGPVDHFQHYYDMFNPPLPGSQKFKFTQVGAAPGPSPALCGGICLGQFPNDL